MNIRVGDRRIETPEFGCNPGVEVRPQECWVVRIHPKQRFYTVEFRLPGGTFRQSYQIRDREEIKHENNRISEPKRRHGQNRVSCLVWPEPCR